MEIREIPRNLALLTQPNCKWFPRAHTVMTVDIKSRIDIVSTKYLVEGESDGLRIFLEVTIE